MLRVALKLLVYLSILTSTRTSSSYLDPQSLVNFRRSAANPLMLTAQQQQQQRLGPEIYEADTYEWQPIINSERGGETSSYFVQQLVNANNNMLYTQPSNTNNNRRASKKMRKSKKDRNSSNKQLYENHIKRKNSLSVNIDEALPSDEDVPSKALSSSEIVNHSNNNETISSNHTKNEKYSSAHIDPQHERELQELFGIDGAKKYQEYQLKQHILNQQLDKSEKQDEVKEVPQKKRDSSQGAAEEIQDVSGAMINQMMSRTTRRQREYDVPLIREY